MAEKPCSACPWTSGDERDKAAVSDPAVLAAMKAGNWFCCHVNMGTCHGAQLAYKRHNRKETENV